MSSSTSTFRQLTNYLLLLSFIFASCAKPTIQTIPPDVFTKAHEQYAEKSITHRRFKYADVIHLVNKRKGDWQVTELGKSVQGKSIYQMSYGDGPTKVMLWSQMHGNESTATMALFDLFNFLEGENDEFDEIRNQIKNKLSINFIPMVNPDGMDLWIRRNALDIDLNRDAVALQSPEAVILKNARDNFSPEFGFNLHDQQIYYTAGESPNPATISVLAPAYNYETEINDVRKKAMQVIVGMNNLMQEIAPNLIGKYDDAFEPRAFGDNFQKWGTSTILIESGGYPNDPEKQHIRKLNFVLILNALVEIADQTYTQYALEDYFSIPDNATRLMDLVIRNVSLTKDSLNFKADLGIRRKEVDAHGDYFVNTSIEEFGDLSVFYGYDEFDATGYEVIEGKIYETAFESVAALDHEKALDLLNQGFLAIKVKNALKNELYNLPILVLKDSNNIPFRLNSGGIPNFFLSQNGQLKFAVVNGYLVDLKKNIDKEYKQRVQ
jgi:hypothetical protein